MIDLDRLKLIYREAPVERLEKFFLPINDTMAEFEINTPQRTRMFLAQIGHESGQLRYVEEIASGAAYEGRASLGNTEVGDGIRYKGRGLIQVTGRSNYALCGRDLNLPLVDKPELLLLPQNAARSAGWYWKYKNLNALSDLGKFMDVTMRINGGTNGYADRYKLYQRAFDVIKT